MVPIGTYIKVPIPIHRYLYKFNLMVLSIFQKAMTFDHNFSAFFLKYFFAGIYVMNKKYLTNKSETLKIVKI